VRTGGESVTTVVPKDSSRPGSWKYSQTTPGWDETLSPEVDQKLQPEVDQRIKLNNLLEYDTKQMEGDGRAKYNDFSNQDLSERFIILNQINTLQRELELPLTWPLDVDTAMHQLTVKDTDLNARTREGAMRTTTLFLDKSVPVTG